ncbi:hypothetical protein DEA98_19175 [Brucella pseudogrignonensis]|nr:hypothetical protein [Brucella pseudogrignonensis]
MLPRRQAPRWGFRCHRRQGHVGRVESGALPSLSIPYIGNIHILSFVALLAVPAVSLLMMRTRFGLHLRATGVDPKSARAAGIHTDAFRCRRLYFLASLAVRQAPISRLAMSLGSART